MTSRHPARAVAASTFGVSTAKVKEASWLLRHSKRLADRVLRGELKLSLAVSEAKRSRQLKQIDRTSVPRGKHRCIVLDPAWRFADGKCGGAAERVYPTMSFEQIRDLPVANLADDRGAHVFLWCPSLHLEQGIACLKGWGFEFVTTIIWFKGGRLGLGRYFRNAHEVCLFGVKGKLPLKVRNAGTVINAPITKHSAKPDAFFDLVERASHSPKIELFARNSRPGWRAWGAEAPTKTRADAPIHRRTPLIKPDRGGHS